MSKNVFISHASEDKEFIRHLEKWLSTTLDVKVFATSRPDAISSGADWFYRVLEALDKADALIILLSRAAQNRIWIGFEYGYFWRKHLGKYIHILKHPRAELFSPLDQLQAKSILDPHELNTFTNTLREQLSIERLINYDLTELVTEAARLLGELPEGVGATFSRFEDLIENSEWITLAYTDELNGLTRQKWICTEDIAFQIDLSSRVEEFRDTWIEKLPGDSVKMSLVNLTFAGTLIAQRQFLDFDGGRYFIPMPNLHGLVDTPETESPEIEVYWRRSDLGYKVATLIGSFHLEGTMEAFAEKYGFKIID